MKERLEKAKERIEKSYDECNIKDLAQCLLNLESLYAECFVHGEDTEEFHYAEYLRLMILIRMHGVLDFNGESYEILLKMNKEKVKAGLTDLIYPECLLG